MSPNLQRSGSSMQKQHQRAYKMNPSQRNGTMLMIPII